MECIDSAYLDLSQFKEQFFSSKPFPHIVLENFLKKEIFDAIQGQFQDETIQTDGRAFNSVVEEKKWISLNASLPNIFQKILAELQGSSWIENLRQFTSLDTLVNTGHGNTALANYHVMKPGGVLGSHVDHSSEPKLNIPHVLNIIICLSATWEESDGGATLLFDQLGKKVEKRIPYKPNQAIVFLHTPYSFHGVERIKKESKKNRRTIYIDYYSESFQPYIKMNLAFDNRWFSHGTTFKLGSWHEYLMPKNTIYAKSLLKYNFNKYKAKLQSSL